MRVSEARQRSPARPNRRRGVAAPSGDGGRRESASATVYRALREEIIRLKRRPGEPIAEMEIAHRHGVSRTPVREALLRLAAEGLVDTIAKSGTFVARIPAAELHEAIVVRKALEEVTARAAAASARRSDVTNLRALVERQREAAARGDYFAFHRADEAFHAMVAAVGGYPGIWSLVQKVKAQIDRYRRLTLPQPGRMTRAIKEHATVLVAIEQHNPDRAASAMGAHINGLCVSMDDIRRLNPDFFYEDIHAGDGPLP
ncbi:MAG TPA: GntR family transcriptional regulator [Casimicrobiaceae bacterium]|nr:GntR family transcriptional regulator [Casimicrobiaceae bacterium]